MKINEVGAMLPSLLAKKLSVYLWGPPGVGKSSIVKQVAEKMGLEFIDLRAILLDPTDLRGLPCIKGATAKWLPPAFLPKSGEGILCLDELATAPPLVQNSCLQLIWDRRVGEYELPKGWHTVACSNRTSDRAGAHRVGTALLNRFTHLEVHADLDDWCQWSINNGVGGEIRSFLRFKPESLFMFQPESQDPAFPTPRSWEMASRVYEGLKGQSQTALFSGLAGTIGKGAASEFLGFLEVWGKLPNLDDIIKAPKTYPIPTEPSVVYATVGALCERARNAKTAELRAILNFVLRLPREYTALGIRDLEIINKEIWSFEEIEQWFKEGRGK